ncbi:hypothetical protein [Halorarum halobium]|uniref:Nmad3 family putative nucleotide modification protein n=1 Tax=Halorarum halobium TaxID=3075121 RepID=UPI0028AA1509|nr:hypothetical protein [Halobaculum sp. XH14]
MPRAVAINVAANTNLPGSRGPVFPDGSFVYVPIPEREPTAEPVATYRDLGLADHVPAEARELPVHLDPEFAGSLGRESYTYGDPHGVKAGPLSRLEPGDFLLFYATLSRVENGSGGANGEVSASGEVEATGTGRDWLPPEWGAFLVGEFEVAAAVTGDEYRAAAPDAGLRERFASNAHARRDPFDAAALVGGTDRSRLYERAVPLSTPEAGADANRLVTELSNDSGKGPWWRRVLRYDEAATRSLREHVETDPAEWPV